MKKIAGIAVRRYYEEQPDLSDLGKFSDTAGDYAIHHSEQRGTFRFFNADNVENMEQAKENYDRAVRFANEDLHMLGIRADALVRVGDVGAWLNIPLHTAGLWGIESDSSPSYFTEVENQELYALSEVLKELGFTQEEIDAVEVTRDEKTHTIDYREQFAMSD